MEVLRIPTKRSDASKLQVSTIKIPSGPNLKPGTLESRKLRPGTIKLEEQLKQIPNIMEANEVVFCWDRRVLVDKVFDGKKISEENRGRYFMYKCTDPDLGLPVNETFTKLSCPRIYGDVFVFRLKESDFSESGGARYAKMGSARDSKEANTIIFALCFREDEIIASWDE